jgi:hypothetical protein
MLETWVRHDQIWRNALDFLHAMLLGNNNNKKGEAP